MIENLLSRIGASYPLTEKDPGEFAALKARGMKFTVRAFEAAGLGRISVMCAKGFFGLMKMDTLIIDPFEIDLPLYSYDRILAMGNDTLIAELYDTCLSPYDQSDVAAVKARFASLPERDPGEHWYDEIRLAASLSKKGKGMTPALDELAQAHFDAYLDSKAPAVADKAAKRAKAAEYVDGLLSHGGPSTDVFKEKLGEEKCARLFRAVLFGTEA
ncbi:MAG: hypothetical protein II776_01960 [Clostridia bacterium]|nr:hypothetical protein [Clostridia bacterium]